MSDPFDDPMINKAISKQQAQRQNAAYKKGQARNRSNNSGGSGSPGDDGYGDMTPDEREAYKKGYRGD